jgi:hypothetical protein
VRSESDEPVEIFLGGDGPGVLTAENIFAPSQVEVVNEDLHIATLNANGHLEMYLTVERGRGYVTADANKRSNDPIGVIAIDSSSARSGGCLPGRVDACRADDQLRRADPRRRDRRLAHAGAGAVVGR